MGTPQLLGHSFISAAMGRWRGAKLLLELPIQPFTWMIIPVCKWLRSPAFISHEKTIWKGSHVALLGGLTITHGYYPPEV